MTGGISTSEFIDVVEAEGDILRAASRSRGPEAAVQACPGWTIRDLVAHLGWVYRWVTSIVDGACQEAHSPEEREQFRDPDPSDGTGALVRLGDAHLRLLRTLQEAPPELSCWTTWPVSEPSRHFWARRMVHETLVHRVDAQDDGTTPTSLGRDLDAVVAADGIDEMVCGFARRYRNLRAPSPMVLALQPTDAPGAWWVALGPDEPTFGRGGAPGDATQVRATAGELYLLLWNRRPATGMHVTGDPTVLEAWLRGSHL